jgi:hypothetical protein
MTQQNQPPRPTNPFASASRLPGSGSAPSSAPTGSRFGSSTPSAPPPPPSRPPGSLGGRLPTRMDWRIIPVVTQLVRFDLDGLGDPFYRLLGKRLVVDFGDPSAVGKAMEAGGADVDEIAARLDAAWADYSNLDGAILLYRWNKDLGYTLAGQMPPDEDEFDEGDSSPSFYDDDKPKAPTILRALDMLLVMNVLARTRSNILLKPSPLALDSETMRQSFYSDDPRLLALVHATGCIEEAVLK